MLEGGERGAVEMIAGEEILQAVLPEFRSLAAKIAGIDALLESLPTGAYLGTKDVDLLIEDVGKRAVRFLSTNERKRLVVANVVGGLLNSKHHLRRRSPVDIKGCLSGCVLLLDDVLDAYDVSGEDAALFSRLRSSGAATVFTSRRNDFLNDKERDGPTLVKL